jgi:hypothetical protein
MDIRAGEGREMQQQGSTGQVVNRHAQVHRAARENYEIP